MLVCVHSSAVWIPVQWVHSILLLYTVDSAMHYFRSVQRAHGRTELWLFVCVLLHYHTMFYSVLGALYCLCNFFFAKLHLVYGSRIFWGALVCATSRPVTKNVVCCASKVRPREKPPSSPSVSVKTQLYRAIAQPLNCNYNFSWSGARQNNGLGMVLATSGEAAAVSVKSEKIGPALFTVFHGKNVNRK